MRILAVAAAVMAWGAAGPAAACGDPDNACRVDGRAYYFKAPERLQEPAPVLLHLHGMGGSGAGVLRSKRLVETATTRGYVVIAPTGETVPFRGGQVTNWKVKDGRDGYVRDRAFLEAVLDDLGGRLPIDRDRVLLSGFSRGGSFVWDVACAEPGAFAAYAPIAGGFWEPMARDCAGPVKLLHTHGWRDKTVPLEGRMLGGGRFQQGDIFKGMIVWRAENGCANHRADAFETTDRFWRRRWDECAAGALEFALHDGGHSRPEGWTRLALEWFEGL